MTRYPHPRPFPQNEGRENLLPLAFGSFLAEQKATMRPNIGKENLLPLAFGWYVLSGKKRTPRLLLALLLALMLAVFAVTPLTLNAQDDAGAVSYTYAQPSGNHLVRGVGTFPDVAAASVVLDSTPLWVVGGMASGAPAWVVALDDGRVVAVQLTDPTNGASALTIELDTLPVGQPIAARFGEGLPQLLTVGADASPLSHPVAVDGGLVYITTNGDLVLWRDGQAVSRLLLDAPLDARIAVSADGQLALYSQQTQRYAHGIMGDGVEGGALALVNVTGEGLSLAVEMPLAEEYVFEGLMPLWADVDGDDIDELLTTVSGADSGAFLRVYDIYDSLIIDSDPIGQGYRWRHQIAVGPFGVGGETQIVDMRTPHIGGMAEFIDIDMRGLLAINNAQLGYTTHVIGSRNLDMTLAGNFDGQATPEVVVTDPAQQTLIALVNTDTGVQEAWTLPLDGTLTSNLAAVTLPDGALVLAAGTDANALRIWHSTP